MHSKNDVLVALDSFEEACRTLSGMSLHQLRPAEQRAVLLRLDAVDRQLATFSRRVLRSLVTGPMPVEFAGGTWPEVLARRLRISVGEAQRRIAEAVSADHPKTA